MSTHNEDVDYKLKINKRIVDIEKAMSEIRLTNKKIKWYEYVMILAGVGAVITFTKLFL